MQAKKTVILMSAALTALAVTVGGCQSNEVLGERAYIPAPESDVSVPEAVPGAVVTANTEAAVVEEPKTLIAEEAAPVATETPQATAKTPAAKYPKFAGKKSGPSAESIASHKSVTVKSNAKAGSGEYVVKAGDSLSTIAQRNGVKTADLAAVNGLSYDSVIRVGQKLKLPEGVKAAKTGAVAKKSGGNGGAVKATKSAARPADGVYTVEKGDNLWTIARKFDTTGAKICELNNISSDKALQIGQKLRLPGASTVAAKTPSTTPAVSAPVSTSSKASIEPTVTAHTTASVSATAPAEATAGASATVPAEAAADVSATAPAEATAGASATAPAAAEAETPAATTQTMTIPRDISLENFCRLYRWNIDEIKALNPNLPADGILRQYQVIVMPVQNN